jgi:CRISPR-associated endonuclease/helicase Cas3
VVKTVMAHYRKSDNTVHFVGEHLQDVGLLAADFAGKLNISLAGELIRLLHDIGKYSQAFQNYIQSAVGLVNCDEDDYVDANAQRGKIDHSSAGAQYIWQALSGKGERESQIAQMLALCVASHHSGLIDCLDVEGEDTFSHRMDKATQKTHLDEVRGAADTEIIARVDELLGKPELFTELCNIISNIITKNSEDYRGKRRNAQQQIGLAVRYLFSCLIDADRIDTADFEHQRVKLYRPSGDYAKWPELIARLERKLAAMLPTRPIDDLRRDISQHCLDAACASTLC